MATLFETWHPVTCDFGLIDASVDRTATALVRWHAGIGTTYSKRKVHSLEQGLQALAPLSAEKRRILLAPTCAGWTAFFQSGISGSDPFPAMSQLAEQLEVRAMRVCALPLSAKWPAVIWEVYAPAALGGEPPLGYRRAIACSNDGGKWRFSNTGAPFDFEIVSAYQAPNKRDRFTIKLLASYLREFGLSPFEDEFYPVSSDRLGVLLESRRRWASPPSEYSLAEVVAGLPWSGR